MDKFRTGNVIKNPHGSILIFEKYLTLYDGKRGFSWLSFDHENSSGISRVEDEEYEEICSCADDFEDEFEDYNLIDGCNICNGAGTVTKTRLGEKHFTLLASNCKDYLKNLLTNALSAL